MKVRMPGFYPGSLARKLIYQCRMIEAPGSAGLRFDDRNDRDDAGDRHRPRGWPGVDWREFEGGRDEEKGLVCGWGLGSGFEGEMVGRRPEFDG